MNYTYLNEESVHGILETGGSVQQWLSVTMDDGFRIIKWIEIDAMRNGKYGVFLHDALDTGSENDIDITEFYNTNDVDSPEGILTEYDSISDALQYCTSIGARDGFYVKICQIQYIYQDYVRKNGIAPKGINEYFS